MSNRRSKYSTDDKATVNLALTLHDGNVKRTARETGIPEATVRSWKKDWEKAGVPAVIEHAAIEAAQRFVSDAAEVRDLAIAQLRVAIPKSDKVRDLATVVGILDDKIVRAQGKPTTISQSTEIQISGSELREMFAGYARSALQATEQRELDIIEAEVVEQP